ncbi:L,D-transpeptidase [Salininema proteolyticum]|uniref:Ig-like domain-containing protein n=1 Tax=Salininema proteolyticum TaxID=1607685 RepID=A0ABV8TZL7_9ACTN
MATHGESDQTPPQTQDPAPAEPDTGRNLNRRRALTGAAIVGAGVAAGAGIGAFAAAKESQPTATYTPPPKYATFTTTVFDGIHPAETFTVDVVDGQFDSVTVADADGNEVDGDLDDGATQWKSKGVMLAEHEYTVTAKATSVDDKAGEFTQAFTTGSVDTGDFTVVDVTPTGDDFVGVGAPIIVDFNKPAPDKKAVEKLLRVESEHEHKGAWRWIGETRAVYRTEEYWKPHQKVTFTADLKSAYIGNDEWGGESYTVDLKIGREFITKTDLATHQMDIFIDGALDRSYPTSGGKEGFLTPEGVYLVMVHEGTVRMIPDLPEDHPEYYDLDVEWSTRMNWSGIYVHAAPWSESDQGKRNVSHGCLNLMPDRAKWFHENSRRGDPIEVVNTGRPLPWDDGWSFWQMDFDSWKEGSALV